MESSINLTAERAAAIRQSSYLLGLAQKTLVDAGVEGALVNGVVDLKDRMDRVDSLYGLLAQSTPKVPRNR